MKYLVRRITRKEVRTADETKISHIASLEGEDNSKIKIVNEREFEFEAGDEMEITTKKTQKKIGEFAEVEGA